MHKYEKIRAELIQRINTQVWAAGETIPHEDDLATEFAVARGTIRQALSSLVEAGLLDKKRKAGTRVTYPKLYDSKLRIPFIRQEVEQRGGVYRYQLLKRATSKLELRALCLHLCDGRPYQLERRLINLEAIPSASNADFKRVSPNEWLLEHQLFSSADTSLRAETPTEDDAKFLNLSDGEPVFTIRRETRLDGMWLARSRLSHPGNSFEIKTEAEHRGMLDMTLPKARNRPSRAM
ncbi:MAG: GntR family transcriptional regulator [Pseudomonadota bacterium]